MSINLSALANWLIKDLVQLPDPVRVEKLFHVLRFVVEHPQGSGFCQVIYIVSFRTHNDRRPSKFIVLANDTGHQRGLGTWRRGLSGEVR